MRKIVYRVYNNEMTGRDAALLAIGIVAGLIIIGVLLSSMGVKIAR